MKKIVFSILVMLFSFSLLQAEQVKIFDLKQQILQTSGKKIEKFKVDDLVVSTNMLFDENKDLYTSGNFSLTFDEPQSKLLIYLNMDFGNATWKMTDKSGESVYVYVSMLRHIYTFTVNGKTYKAHGDFKMKIQNEMLTLYANNKKVFTMGLDTLTDDIKTISFSPLRSISNCLIYK